jgi:probable phosphoglycerate mutase
MSSEHAVRWPERLWIVRHGESSGNVARDAAYASGLEVISVAERDVDVQLSPLGEQQSEALARWFADMDEGQRPTAIISSPYRRAIETAEDVRRATGLPEPRLRADERLREREFGILDRLTRRGIELRYPEEAERRKHVGKFYHRPPGGESWCDVILRLRSVLDTISLHHSGRESRVLIVAHQVVVLCLRYLLEEMTEEQILGIDRQGDVANCGVTEYALAGDSASVSARGPQLELVRYNFVAPLIEAGAPVTATPDLPAGTG